MKNNLREATGSGSSGRMRIPLVLAPQLWEREPLEPFVTPVSDYVSAVNAYDSYDGKRPCNHQKKRKESYQ
jgi:hypothetical protein